MKKFIVFTFIITCFSYFLGCSSSDTYAERLKKERKSIKNFWSDSSFVVIGSYPADGVFGENEFFQDPKSGVYFNVIDSGNGNRASKVPPQTQVSVRINNTHILGDPTVRYENESQAEIANSIIFTYGDRLSYTESSNTFSIAYMVKSSGLVAPLEYVGEGAVIKLLVPSTVGSTYQQTAIESLYFGHVKYNFRPEQEN